VGLKIRRYLVELLEKSYFFINYLNFNLQRGFGNSWRCSEAGGEKGVVEWNI
jgi:hypothetical protein